MNKKLISLSVVFFVLLSTLPIAQAYPLETYLETYLESRKPQSLEENDSQYYISLRWLVYMLILSLPIAPSQAQVTHAPPLINWVPHPPVVAMKEN
jgi:hypothetical protein